MNIKKKKQSLACFSRWTRKGYAVFNSLQKQVKICVLAPTLSLVGLPVASVVAQQTTTNQFEQADTATNANQPIQLENVTVKAEIPFVKSESAPVLTLISKEQLAQLPVTDIQSLLKTLSGVDVRQRGANGVQADVSVRGGTPDQISVLINGINFTDPQTGHYNLNLPMDLASIDRIEILEGSANTTSTANSLSGAINMVTGQVAQNQLQLKATTGQFGLFNASANGALHKKIKPDEPGDDLTFFAAANYNRSDGYIENTDYKILNTFFQTRYRSSQWGTFNWQGGYQKKDFGANGFYSLAYPNQFDATRTLFSSLSWQKKVSKPVLLSSDASYRRHRDRFELFRSDAPAWYTEHNYHETRVAEINLNAVLSSRLGNTTLGAKFRNEHIFSNKLGDLMSSPREIPYEETTAMFTHEKSRNAFNLAFNHVVYLKKTTFNFGFVETVHTRESHYNCLGGNISYQLFPHFKLFTSAYQSLRLPTFTDLYYQSPTHHANPALKPEQATTFDLGLKQTAGSVQWQAAAFYRLGKNMIDWIKINPEDRWQSQNHAKVNTFGLETSLAYKAPPSRFLKSFSVDYAFLSSQKKQSAYVSSYVLDYVKHKLVLSSVQRVYRDLNISCMVSFVDREGSYLDANTQHAVPYPLVALVDAKIFWSSEKWTFFVEADNLFNTRYCDFGSLYQPGIWVKAGIEMRFFAKKAG